MTRLTRIYKRFDVIVIPFPFTDLSPTKKRPALVISDSKKFNDAVNHVVCAMITDARHDSWPLDTEIQDLTLTGLSKPSMIRLKIFTLDESLILKRAGKLGLADRQSFRKNLRLLLGIK